jgi:hypothetical protein
LDTTSSSVVAPAHPDAIANTLIFKLVFCHQIQVFTDEIKVTAKPVLRKIIKNRNLDIPLTGINTRIMGRKVMEQIKQQG